MLDLLSRTDDLTPFIPFFLFDPFCSLVMNLARRLGTVATDDTVMTSGWTVASLFFDSFPSSSSSPNFCKTYGSNFRREAARIFFFFFPRRVYDDGVVLRFLLQASKKMYDCASNPQKSERQTDASPILPTQI